MIYFIQDSRTFQIKIGYAKNDAEARMATLQTGNPVPLVLLATMDGERRHEAELHRRFAAYRIGGEWFDPAPPLLKALISWRMARDRSQWELLKQGLDNYLIEKGILNDPLTNPQIPAVEPPSIIPAIDPPRNPPPVPQSAPISPLDPDRSPLSELAKLTVGMHVKHPHYGTGEVTETGGKIDSERYIKVRFPKYDIIAFRLPFAQLTIVHTPRG